MNIDNLILILFLQKNRWNYTFSSTGNDNIKITVNLIFPFVGYLITGNKKGMVKGYFYGAIVSVIFWSYFGYMLIKPKELWEKLIGKA